MYPLDLQSVSVLLLSLRNGNANWSLYFSTLDFLLSTITVPYYLLGAGYFFSDVLGKLNSYYRNIISSVKQTEPMAVPLMRISKNLLLVMLFQDCRGLNIMDASFPGLIMMFIAVLLLWW